MRCTRTRAWWLLSPVGRARAATRGMDRPRDRCLVVQGRRPYTTGVSVSTLRKEGTCTRMQGVKNVQATFPDYSGLYIKILGVVSASSTTSMAVARPRTLVSHWYLRFCDCSGRRT